ncbi:hypothetical protein KVT40_001097 [Elsinoe batatas]|uniref:Calcineurin-like phosphoesterase domain-containing protein n=1 Tax=Elsinoe batatas TaxID=2601811 RepID=A0A8K0L9X9_9PEZI|nr:hypothetical protein KVT40_001097 [Elsinoe batatas]
MATSFQYMSDLHLERIRYIFTITKHASRLILAGDIGRFCDYDQFRDFLSKQCEPHMFDEVLLVAGNHEFYGSSREEGLLAADKMVQEPCMHNKLRFLNRTKIEYSTVTILACTLHSHIGEGYTRLTNDFSRIRDWSVTKHNEEHGKDLEWLRNVLTELKKQPKRGVIIVTHYAPTFKRVCHPKKENNDVSQCFSSNALSDLQGAGLLKPVTHWLSGHTHFNARFREGRTLLMSNQFCNDDKDLTWWQKKLLHRPFDPSAIVRA